MLSSSRFVFKKCTRKQTREKVLLCITWTNIETVESVDDKEEGVPKNLIFFMNSNGIIYFGLLADKDKQQRHNNNCNNSNNNINNNNNGGCLFSEAASISETFLFAGFKNNLWLSNFFKRHRFTIVAF